jgi:hypothetical protein
MRLMVTAGALALFLLAPPQSPANISTVRTRIAEIHVPGSEKGGKFGALTLAWGNEGAKPELRTVLLTEHSKLTAPGKEGRAPAGLKDLKVDMTVVAEMSANRLGDTSWKLDALHVLDTTKPADPALVKLLGSGRGGFVGKVGEVAEPAPDRKGDLGRIVVRRDKEAITFHVTKDTEILRQSGDGKQSTAKFTDLKGGCGVVVSYPAPLVTGDPPNVPATRVILLGEAK